MLFTNSQVSQILQQHADALEVSKGDRFRIAAYRRAADSIEHLSSEAGHVWKEGDLTSIPGVGEGIAAHLDELFRTGSVKEFGKLKKSLPKGMFELSKLPGVGGKRAFKLAKLLNLSSIQDLKEAIIEGKVALLEGFGAQSQSDLRRSIIEWESRSNRILLYEALCVAQAYLQYLKELPQVTEAEALGSLRRCVSTVGDIDLAVATRSSQVVLDHFVKYPRVAKIVSKGDVKATVLLKNDLQVDLMTCGDKNWGALLQHFTGSKLHNIHLRKIAQDQSWRLSEKAAFKDETELYKRLHLAYIPPELREDTGEIEAANLKRKTLPRLLEISDIKGDLQMHSIYSDGINTIEEIARKVSQMPYRYICISDHSPSISTNSAFALQRWINNRKEEMALAEKKYPKVRIINGVEVNIPAEGGLALPDELLKEFAWVIASIHSSFRKNRQQQTKRVLSALENPYVKILGHPTGQILLERQGISADWDAIFKFAANQGKLMEINAYPNRLDLPDILARKAKSFGVKFAISTDAHSTAHLDYMEFGVFEARRAWLEAKDIVNTLPWTDFRTVIYR